MISAQPAIPILVHEDCMSSISTGLARQEDNIASINDYTKNILNWQRIIASNTNLISPNTNNISSSIGQTTDAASANTVIGLLKSISNKL